MKKLTVLAALLAVAAVIWMAGVTHNAYLSTGESMENPRSVWVSNQWSANVATDALTLDTDQLKLTLPTKQQLTAHRSHVFQRRDGTLVWHGALSAADEDAPEPGTFEVGTNSILLVSLKDRVTGTLRWDGQVYQLRFANGGYVLKQVNQSQLPPDHEPEPYLYAPANQPIIPPPAHEPGHAAIRVLIVATKEASEAHDDLPALAHLAIEESNQTYLNSEVDMSLELADFRQLDYQQSSSSPDIDLRRIVAPADGFMDDVHQQRDDLKADVVVLMVNTIRESCGRAAARPASADTAFVYVNLQCIGVWRFTTGHEIGHLQGASLEYSEGVNDPFLYGHGFIHEPEGEHGWRTVMANPVAENTVRVPFWSDPERFMDSVPMGVAETADNRRVLEETKWTIAGFR